MAVSITEPTAPPSDEAAAPLGVDHVPVNHVDAIFDVYRRRNPRLRTAFTYTVAPEVDENGDCALPLYGTELIALCDRAASDKRFVDAQFVPEMRCACGRKKCTRSELWCNRAASPCERLVRVYVGDAKVGVDAIQYAHARILDPLADPVRRDLRLAALTPFPLLVLMFVAVICGAAIGVHYMSLEQAQAFSIYTLALAVPVAVFVLALIVIAFLGAALIGFVIRTRARAHDPTPWRHRDVSEWMTQACILHT